MLHLSQFPESVLILGVQFPVVFGEFEDDDQGECKYEPEPGGTIQIKIAKRFEGTDWAWLVLAHEMTHAALAVSGATALMGAGGQVEEAVVLATEAVWHGLVAVGKQQAKRVAGRGSKGRTTRTKKSIPSRRRPGR